MKDDENILKEHQRPLTVEEQIDNLKEIGLVIEDEEYTQSVLKRISYFRLIKKDNDFASINQKNGFALGISPFGASPHRDVIILLQKESEVN